MKALPKTCTLAAACVLLASCGANEHDKDILNERPSYLGAISSASYDGQSNDLLTAGLGKSGLAGASPVLADPLNPSAAELRRLAIFYNYRAVLDIAANSGYGSLYGPNVDAKGNVTAGEGLIAGTEYIAYADDGSGNQNVTLMVQVPDSFDPNNPCIVTGTSSGSRGIYGAIGSAGEWGLKNRCAVAYADKGSGTGLYTFDDDAVNLQNGVRATRTVAGKNAIFAPVLNDADRIDFRDKFPGRIAFKHAHSQQNPEKDWGKVTLQAVEFAFYVLNEKYGTLASDNKSHILRYTAKNTITIASSISNGGGSALLEAEQDTRGLISGVAVSEPQIQPKSSTGYTVRQGGAPVSAQGKALFDYSTYAALYQPCIAATALNPGRCTALAAKGLLSGNDLASQQNDAVARLKSYGWLADSNPLQSAHAPINISVAVTYANAYGKFSVKDNVCGFSFAAVDASGSPVAFSGPARAASFGTQSGIIGSIIYENSVGANNAREAKLYALAVSPSSGLADQALDGFLCLRGLATGLDPVTGAPLSGEMAANSARVRAGMADVAATGNLRGKPAIIVQGRADTLIPVNHASRAYLGLNASVEGNASRLRYIEVMNANHFDSSFTNALPAVVVPLHIYLFRALDAMYANLKNGASSPLPPSQVVRTLTRPNATTPITVLNVPVIASSPAAADAIGLNGTMVDVPN